MHIDAVSAAQPSHGSAFTDDYNSYIDVPGTVTSGANSFLNSAVNSVKSAVSSAASGLSSIGRSSPGVDTTGMYKFYDPNAAAVGSSGSFDFSLPDYPNAALSSLYGMDQETAYQEALANTAIQRRMQDYKAAGLNPVLAARYNSGADSFSGSVAYPMSFGASQGSSASGSPSGSFGGSSAKSSLGSGLGRVLKNSDYRSAIAALASAGTMAVTKSFPLGAAAYYGVKGLLNSFSRK